MSIFGTGISGLQAAQLGLLTTEHNIANASTAGFNRQRIVQASNTAMLTGSGFVGQGTNVSTIERLYNGFLSGQVSSAQTVSSELEAYYAEIKKIDNMLADADAGVSPALQDFFTGVQQVAANPALVSSRQAMLSSAQALVARYRGIDTQLTQLYDGVNSQISSTVGLINAYSSQIAHLNESITIAESSVQQPANDLRDQRDQIVLDLNKLVKVATTSNSDGSFNVYIGNGQQLVVGTQVMTMTAQPSSADPSRIVVGLKTPGGSQEMPESLLTGGTLSGLLSFRRESLDRAANDLGRNAASLALTFNAQNALGQDLLGNAAGDANFVASLFTVSGPSVVANERNLPASPDVGAVYNPPKFNGNFYTDLTNSDYRLDYDGSQLTLTRLSDQKQWSGATINALNGVLAQPGNEQGFTLSPASFGPADANASYLIRPARDAAKNLAIDARVAADPRLLAAAAPIRTQATAGNTGGATISAGSVATGYTAPTAGSPLTLTYSGGSLTGFPAGTTVSVTQGGTTTNYTAPAPVAFATGATITFAGISVQIDGSPNNGDSFTIARNSAGVSDGRNALLLGKLQTQNTMSGQKASFQSAYSQLVSDAGNKSREIAVKGEAQASLLKQAENARDSLSGVNLDEEATNLLRYQQAYQAAAKIMQVGNKLFDELLAVVS